MYERSFYFWLENNLILYLFCFITLFFSLFTFLNPSVISIYFCISYFVIIIGKCRNYLSILIILVAVPLASRGDCITLSQNLNVKRNFQWKSFVLLFLSFSFDISMLYQIFYDSVFTSFFKLVKVWDIALKNNNFAALLFI